MIQLYEHQIEGSAFLLSHKKACLFFEIGTGKTFTALDALTHLPPGRVLIVAPKVVLTNVWLKDDNYDLSRYDVTYINYEKVARSKDFQKNVFDYIILDECHKLKGRTTKTSRKFRLLCRKAQYVFGLTGTPVANNYADVYNIYRNMDILEFDMSYDEFVFRYYYTYQINNGGFTVNILDKPKPFMVDELVSRIGRHSMTKRAEDCIQLPDKTTDIHYIEGMGGAKYREIEKGILKVGDTEEVVVKLEAITKAHQAANGFIYFRNQGAVKIAPNRKLTALNDLLEMTLEESEHVIVVYLYAEDLRQLQTLQYDWTTDPGDFENHQVLFLQFSRAEGLNLQYCNQMIFYTYDYSFLKFEQMSGRIYRNGQKQTCHYRILISKNTIEEKVWKAIEKKQSLDEFLKEVLHD